MVLPKAGGEDEKGQSSGGGVWIGIDLGTSNSACAVWDSTRGSSKWMRLPDIAAHESAASSKWGRLVPSVVKIPSSSRRRSLVGAHALREPAGTLISSVKRLLGRKLADLDTHWVESSLPYDVIEDDQGELKLVVETYVEDNEESTMFRELTPVQVLGILLKGMRDAAETYLKKYAVKKHLEVPGGASSKDGASIFLIRNAVIGVPAHFSKRQIALIEQAARLAGLDGTISTCLESTAAAMAYGLTLQETSDDANIMVIDMGGGTSDITVACKNNRKRSDDTITAAGENIDDLVVSSASSYQVLVTTGEERLGGDDIDQALVDYCMEKMFQDPDSLSFLSKRVISSQLLKSCRNAKEKLCDLEPPCHSQTIRIVGETSDVPTRKAEPLEVEIDQNQFETILKPWLDQARGLIRRAIENFDEVSSDATKISEVILVGGTTRVPAIRRMIQKEFFPNIEIGTSLNPTSSVAQGLAIHAALISRLVPAHQLRSALMLDCIPHAIGVLLGEQEGENRGTFIEILKRNASLPARGSTTFTLADKSQPGVTIRAVEKIGQTKDGEPLYEDMAKEPFTFLLRRLSKEQLVELTHRSIEVGMKVDMDGQFIVSIFDEMDPEQVRKRERYEKEGQIIGFQQADIRSMFRILSEDSNFTGTEQFVLVGLLVVSVMMYITVKLVFNEDLLVVRANDGS